MTESPTVVFVVGILCEKSRSQRDVLEVLDGQFGRRRIDVPSYPFDFTNFYDDELGSPLIRCWYVYQALFNPAQISSRKQSLMSIEDQFRSSTGDRVFNIDAGYVSGAKFVLASRKNYSNRVYMGNGIYAEVTLRYEQNEWRPTPNTYPEFRGSSTIDWLDKAREYWKTKKTEKNPEQPAGLSS